MAAGRTYGLSSEELADVRQHWGLPDSHPTTRLVAATHEAVHVAVAATFGVVSNGAAIGAANGPDELGPGGAAQLPADRFGPDVLVLGMTSNCPATCEAA